MNTEDPDAEFIEAAVMIASDPNEFREYLEAAVREPWWKRDREQAERVCAIAGHVRGEDGRCARCNAPEKENAE